MTIEELEEQECTEVLSGASFGRLACSLDGQPYVVPIFLEYDANFVYALSTKGQKIEWMRKNPKVCVQIDEIRTETDWTSIVVNGTYQELPEPQFTQERAHARKLLERRLRWWQPAMAERQMKTGEQMVDPLFFRIRVDSITGLRSRK